ncbi:MAG: HEAT repeat domain-containing protein [Desulfobacterales bacterium]
MKRLPFLLLMIFFISGGFFTAAAGKKAEIQITVMLNDTDVSLEAQVMLLQGYTPNMLNPGEKKYVSLEPGDYQITVLLPEKKKEILPIMEKITVEPGENKNMTFNLQAMPAMQAGPGRQPTVMAAGKATKKNEDKFEPKDATEAQLREALETEDGKLQKSAFNELYKRRKLSFLGEMLSHQKGAVRELSLTQLYNLTVEWGSPTSPIDDNRPEIIKCLHDPHLPARIKAMQIMDNYRDFPDEAVPVLIKALKDPETEVRLSAARSLGGITESEREGVKGLADVVRNDSEAGVRRAAIYSLGRIKVSDSLVYESLAGALSDEDRDVRRESARVLAEIGASASMLKEITAGLKDSDPQVRRNLLSALQGLDSADLKAVIHPVAQMLEDKDRYVRIQAVRAIGSAGPAGAEVLPALINALSDERREVIQEAARTIDALGSQQARKALPQLLELLSAGTSGLGYDTVFAVSSAVTTIGKPAIPSLLELLSHGNFEVRAQSANILGRIGPDAEEAVPGLTSIYKNENEHDAARREAYFAIEHITGEKPEL